jgi:hypothetical protein
MSITVTTNNVPRNVIEAYELTPAERADFDYLDWDAIDADSESATFFRYRGRLYDLGEFSTDYGMLKGSGLPEHLTKWDGYASDSFFSAVVVRYCNNYDQVVVGTVLS